jgi:NADH-quinone oxidoreductase subunit A
LAQIIMISSPYFPLAVLFFAALGFGLAPLGMAWAWAKGVLTWA